MSGETKSRATSLLADVLLVVAILVVGAAIYLRGHRDGQIEARNSLLCFAARISGETLSVEAARYCNRFGERVASIATPVEGSKP